MDINKDIADKMVDEANVAFRLNMELFQELDGVAGFTEENADSSTPSKSVHDGVNMAGTPPPECPFSAMLSGKSVPKSREEESSKTEEPPKEVPTKQSNDIEVSKKNIPKDVDNRIWIKIILISLLVVSIAAFMKIY